MKNKLAKLFTSKKTSAILFAVAGVLVAGGVVGGARAVLSASSEDYVAALATREVGVELLENDAAVPDGGALLENLTGEDGGLKLGKVYEEKLAVRNNSEVDSFVRVILHTSWKEEDSADAAVDTALNPELIELGITENSGWILDEKASTPERTVLYYSRSLAQNETTADAVESIAISDKVGSLIEQNDDGTFTYAYDGKVVSVKAEADAVQADSGQEAIRSAWGVDYITVTGDESLSLRQ